MWPSRSHTFTSLTRLTSIKKKFKCKQVKQDDIYIIKRIVACDTLLNYTDFNENFKIHTNSRAFQLGAVISQKGKPKTLYSRNLNYFQQRYTVIDRELLSIVETLREFIIILLGQKLRIYTGNKNLTCKNFNTNIVLRRRLILEEYVPYI